MKRIFYILTFILIIAVACNKDKFTTVPQVSIKSISPSTVNSGNIISLNGEYTDQEGDLDSILVVYKWYAGTTVTKKDTFRYTFSTLNLPPKTTGADIIINFEYNTFSGNFFPLQGVVKDTTATFGLILIDEAENRSGYAESNPIRLIKP